MESGEKNRELIDLLSEEIAGRLRNGERPALEEYLERYPHAAAELRQVFPTLLLMEDLGRQSLTAKSGFLSQPAAGPALRELGDFRILREIGRGGMGVVYEAEQKSLGRRVALKVLASGGLLDPTQLRRFQLEARAAAKLQHPGIVPVYEVGDEAGVHYYAMRLIPGHGLDAVIDQLRVLRGMDPGDARPAGEVSAAARSLSGPARSGSPAAAPSPSRPDETGGSSRLHLPGQRGDSSSFDSDRYYFRSVALIGVQVADALASAHDNGIVHRDIKPSNLLLDADRRIWVTDFGLAKTEGGDPLTTSGDAVGTLRYMGPERFRGWSDPRSDIYGIGATLYELIALQPPFSYSDRTELIRRIIYDNPPLLRRQESRVPRDLETIVMKTLEKEPERRYRSAAELAADLRSFLDNRPIVARRSGAAERTWLWCRRNRLAASLMALITILSLALAIGGYHSAAVTSQRLSRELEERARALRQTDQPGRREESLRLLAEAARNRNDLSLRNEAVTAAALFDAVLWKTFDDIIDRDMGFSADADAASGRWATARADGGIALNSLDDGRELFLLPPASKTCESLRFSPGGRFLAAWSGRDESLAIWDLEARSIRLQSRIQRAPFEFAPFDLTAREAAFLDADRNVTVRDLETGAEKARTRVPTEVLALRFDRRGSRLAAGTSTGIRILQVPGGACRDIPHTSRIRCLDWSPAGDLIAGGDSGHALTIWNAGTGKPLPLDFRYQNDVVTAAFSPDGQHIAASAWGSETIIWEVATGKRTLSMINYVRRFSDDGSLLFATNTPGLEVHRVSWGRIFRPLHYARGRNRTLQAVAYHPQGRLIAGGSLDGLRFWDAAGGAPLGMAHIGPVRSLAFDPRGAALFTSGNAGLHRWPARLEDGPDGSVLTLGTPKPLLEKPSYNLALSSDGRWIAAISEDPRKVAVLDAETGSRRSELIGHVDVLKVAFSPDGRFAATGSFKGPQNIVRVWDPATGAVVADLPYGNGTPLFSPGGGSLITTGPDRPAAWRAGSWEKMPMAGKLDERTFVMGFLSQGRTILSMFFNETGQFIELLDARDGREVVSLRSPSPRSIHSVTASPDENILAIGMGDSRIELWDLRALRAELAGRGLDWSGRELPERRQPSPAGPIQVRLDLGGLAASELIQSAHDLADAGDLDGARRLYEDHLSRNPSDPGVHNDLAWLLLMAPPEHRDPALAVAHAEQAAEGRKTPAVLNTLGLAYFRAGRFTESIEVLEKSLAGGEWDGTPSDWLFIAMCRYNLRDLERAREAWDRCLETARRRAASMQAYNGLQEFRGLVDEARALWGTDLRGELGF